MRYAIIPHRLRYPVIASNVICASLRYDRRKNLSVEIQTLRRNVIAINRIRFLYFIVVWKCSKYFIFDLFQSFDLGYPSVGFVGYG